jgi:hypothetical protein
MFVPGFRGCEIGYARRDGGKLKVKKSRVRPHKTRPVAWHEGARTNAIQIGKRRDIDKGGVKLIEYFFTAMPRMPTAFESPDIS